YKTSYERIKGCYLYYLERNHYHIVSIDDNFGEIYAEIGHMSIQAKIIEQTPLETSIDFYINAEFLFGNKKKTFRFLESVYEDLGKNFELKGLGLRP
ncbi:MAG: hypothetical protein K2I77_04060, partial [Anaeroplasmataceae bacterium]|nr:hypothetical protein [Anaeroplasmataceae bacterium]